MSLALLPDCCSPDCSHARSFLFVPGNRPERFDKALASGADAVVFDLEDSVPHAAKADARRAIEAAWPALRSRGLPLVVRINAVDTALARDDLLWLMQLPPPSAVMVPKADSTAALASVHAQLNGVALLPLIESAAGYAALPSLGGAPGVQRLVVGHIDFMADTGIEPDETETELAPLRFAVAMTTRVHRLAPAVDGVTVQIDDEARLRRDTQHALRFGFGGKLCIHPRQINTVHAAFAPGDAELDWARRVVAAAEAAGGAAVQLDGRMVDLPVVLRAQRTIQVAERANRSIREPSAPAARG